MVGWRNEVSWEWTRVTVGLSGSHATRTGSWLGEGGPVWMGTLEIYYTFWTATKLMR